MRRLLLLIAVPLIASVAAAEVGNDAYHRHIRAAFGPEAQAPALTDPRGSERWETWIYMPWRYKWTIGTGQEGAEFCREYGINGGFTDHGHGPLEWLEENGLPFYNDHTAGKGFLYLRDANKGSAFKQFQRDARVIRQDSEGRKPLTRENFQQVAALVRERVGRLKDSPVRAAYSLDDEVSWGVFVKPLPWRVMPDDSDYADWLKRYYGEESAPEPQWVTPDHLRPQLRGRLKDVDLSPLLDRLTYNDERWAQFVGGLVRAAHEVDPETPAGFVGGQAPNIWGGYNYALLMDRVNFMEAYDLGRSAEIVRSFNPENLKPTVTTHFHKDGKGVANDIWQAWYYFAHGNDGMIGWVDGWFDGDTPRPWLAAFAPTLKELGRRQGPKLERSRWLHDGVAIYYSHPSIQVSWMLDAEAHGGTWINRNNDHKLGTSHLVRSAWCYLLEDAGLQYDFLGYNDVILGGVPENYKVLILPACYALSDVEARRIRAFVERGGTVIADFAAGIFDQHGKGRSTGALDDLFGVEHDGSETAGDFFAGELWVETHQDRGYNYGEYSELFGTLPVRLHEGFAIAEPEKPVAKVHGHGKGRAIYLNLSPQRYLMHRERGRTSDAMRNVFLGGLAEAGVAPWLRLSGPDGNRPPRLEATYWAVRNPGEPVRTFCFVVQNTEVTGSALGGDGAKGLEVEPYAVTVRFTEPVPRLRDERAERDLGGGSSFTFQFNPAEALLFSFDGLPPRL